MPRMMDGGMDHVGSGHACDEPDGVFSYTILELGTNTTECEFLVEFGAVIFELFGIEYSVVRVVALDLYACVGRFLLEDELPTDGVTGGYGLLRPMEHITGGAVDIDCATHVTICRRAVT